VFAEFNMRKLGVMFAVVVLLIVAYALRVHQLGAQSFWYDEGVAYGHSLRSLPEMIPMLQRNVHVPMYFGSLAIWEDIAGHTEFSLRYWSVVFSILSVVFAFAIGKRLYGNVAGIATAGFMTLNAFSIYYAQEARMYAMLVAFAGASFWLFVLWTDAYIRQRKVFEYAFALALVNTAGMYTHFSYALVMVAQGVIAVLWLLALWTGVIRMGQPESRVTSRFVRQGLQPIYTIAPTLRALAVYVILNLITVLLFSPWLEIALRQSGSQPNISDVVSFERMLLVFLGWFSFGNTFEALQTSMMFAVIFLFLFGLVLLPNRPRGHIWRMLIPIILVVVSVVLYSYLNLYERYLRFLIPAQLGMAIVLGRGVWVLWEITPRRNNPTNVLLRRVIIGVAVGAIWFTMVQGVLYLYDDDRYQRDDYRGLGQTISAQTTPDDAVIVSAAGLQEIVGYYYQGSAPLIPLPTQPNPEETRQQVQTLITLHPMIYAVYYGEQEQDPQRVVETTLSTQAYPIDTVWWDDMRFARYATTTAETLAYSATHTSNLMLQSVRVNQLEFDNDTSKVLTLEFAWQTTETLSTPYKVFVQLLNAEGALVAQRDSEPQNGFMPTTTWQPNTPILDHHALLLRDLPTGTYQLIVGLYDPNTGVRQLVNGVDTLAVLNIEIK
jgi:mannosyltransferase